MRKLHIHPAKENLTPNGARPKNAKSIGTTLTVLAFASMLASCGEVSSLVFDKSDSASIASEVTASSVTDSSVKNLSSETTATVAPSVTMADAPPQSNNSQTTNPVVEGSSTPPTSVDVPPQSAPPPPTTQQSSATINSVDTIINDMGMRNDGELFGLPPFFWAVADVPAQIPMGADPRGCIQQPWWLNSSAKAEYKDCDYWTTFVQWFVIYEATGNNATNVRIETRNPQSWYLSKSTGQWTLLGEAVGTTWFLAQKSNIMYVPGGVDSFTGEGGSTVLRVDRNSPYVYHGLWPNGLVDIAPFVQDLGAIYTTVEARLVVDNPGLPDDRSQAFWMMQSGADYYPAAGVPATDALPPGAGLSRTKRITSEWQAFNFATLENARQDYQGPSHALTLTEFRNNPPPLR